MKLSNPREAAMALVTQAESLPKLRDKLLGIVNEINSVLNDGRARGMGKGPRKSPSSRKPARPAGTRKKRQPKAKFLDAMPPDSVNIKGIHKNYRFVPGLGILSMVKDGRIRLLLVPHEKASWTVKNSKGERLFLGRTTLQKKVGMELGL